MKKKDMPGYASQENWLCLLLAALIPGALLLGAAGTAIYYSIPLPAEAFLEEIRNMVVPQAVGHLRPEPRESGTYIGLCLLALPAAWVSLYLAGKMPGALRRLLAGAAMILLLAGCFRSGSWMQIAAPLQNPVGWCVWGALSICWGWLLTARVRISVKLLQILLLLLLVIEVFSSRFYLAYWVGKNLGNEHISIVTYAVERAVHGVPEVHLYGFYPQFLAPFFRISGLTLGNFCLLMAVLYLAVMLILMDAARRWIRQPIFFAGCSLLLLMLMNWHDFLQRTGEIVIEPYYSYFPLRLIFPVTGLFFLLCSSRNLRNAAAAGGIAALGLWFTPDTGLALAGAGTVFYLGGILRRDSRKRALLETAVYGSTALLMLPGTALLLRLISGAWPPVWEYCSYFRDFQKIGYFMLPMEEVFGFWMAAAMIYLGAMIAGIAALRKNGESRRGRMLLFWAVLGCGLFLYYVGRSHPFNLLTCSWPAVLLYFGFAARLWRGVRRKKLSKFWAIGVIPAILLPAGTLGVIAVRHDRIRGGLEETAIFLREEVVITEMCREIREYASPEGKAHLITYAQGALHLESGVQPAIPGFNLPELIFERDYLRVKEAMLSSGAPLVMVGKHWFSERLKREIRGRYRMIRNSYMGFLQIYEPVEQGINPGAGR